MRYDVIKCDVKGCSEEHMEDIPGHGHPGWGALHGAVDLETGVENPCLCPRHKTKLLAQIIEGF